MKILLAVDGSRCAWHALAEATRLLPLRDAEVHVIAVASTRAPLVETADFVLVEIAEQHRLEARDRLDAAVKALASAGVRATKAFRVGDPAREILAYADAFRPDLVVLGSHGHGPLGRLALGSVSDAVAHRWPGAVMVVRPSASAAPVSDEHRRVGELMTPEPVCAQAGDRIDVVAARMKANDTGFIPVLDGEALIGVVTDRDLVVRVLAEGRDPGGLTVGDVCSRDAAVVAPEMPVVEAVALMEGRRIRRLVVMDGRRVVGVLSLGDLAETEHRAADHALVEISRSPKTMAHRVAERKGERP